VTPPSSGTAEKQRLEQQQRSVELAIREERQQRPTGAVVPKSNGGPPPAAIYPKVILTAHKRNKRFESAVSVSALREAVYQMERHGWMVVVGEELASQTNGGQR
jgi:hypothetical protein